MRLITQAQENQLVRDTRLTLLTHLAAVCQTKTKSAILAYIQLLKTEA